MGGPSRAVQTPDRACSLGSAGFTEPHALAGLQVQQYGICLKATLPEVSGGDGGACSGKAPGSGSPPGRLAHHLCRQLQVEKGVCEREFQQLRACWFKSFRAALRASK